MIEGFSQIIRPINHPDTNLGYLLFGLKKEFDKTINHTHYTTQSQKRIKRLCSHILVLKKDFICCFDLDSHPSY